MRRSLLLLLVIWVVLYLPGCEEKRAETPPEVTQAYNKLISSLDPETPGTSFVRLQEFARQNSRYPISSAVEKQIKAWQDKLEEAYLKARNLAREEQFDRAEAILKDLADNLRDEKAGKLSREFLAFDFYYMKASRLLLKRDLSAAETVVKALMKKQLTAEQMTAAQRLLDSISTAGVGLGMASMASLKSAARSVQVLLHSYYAEEGQYPKVLTLESPELAHLRKSGSLGGIVSSIEDYATAQDGFSFVLMGKDPRQRVRVTQNTIEEIQPTR